MAWYRIALALLPIACAWMVRGAGDAQITYGVSASCTSVVQQDQADREAPRAAGSDVDVDSGDDDDDFEDVADQRLGLSDSKLYAVPARVPARFADGMRSRLDGERCEKPPRG